MIVGLLTLVIYFIINLYIIWQEDEINPAPPETFSEWLSDWLWLGKMLIFALPIVLFKFDSSKLQS
jgi:hypothetical protein